MDEHYRKLERRAAAGDEEAQNLMRYMGCRMGQHVLQTDQIIMADDWQHAGLDAGCCQCGIELYNARQLCQMGHHHLFHNSWNAELVYHCVRPRYTLVEIRQLQQARNRAWEAFHATRATTHTPEQRQALVEEAIRLDDENIQAQNTNPYLLFGCTHRLEADDACARGLHFLHITPQGRECRNPNCSYSEADACPHNTGHSLNRDADGREVARCGRCQMSFYDEGICAVFGHHPDDKVENPCIRIRCPEHRQGTNLFEALAAAYRAGNPLVAICREEGQTLATASGWSEKLRGFGVKKPKVSERQENGIRSWLGQPSYRIRVRWSGWDGRPRHGEDYNNISESFKTRWAGKWYPVIPQPAAQTA